MGLNFTVCVLLVLFLKSINLVKQRSSIKGDKFEFCLAHRISVALKKERIIYQYFKNLKFHVSQMFYLNSELLCDKTVQLSCIKRQAKCLFVFPL